VRFNDGLVGGIEGAKSATFSRVHEHGRACAGVDVVQVHRRERSSRSSHVRPSSHASISPSVDVSLREVPVIKSYRLPANSAESLGLPRRIQRLT
jgi:hypothetical protein